MRLHSVSLYNVDADVLWLSEGALGPDEHNVVIEAIETQKNDKTQSYYEFGMGDGRMAVFLPIRGPRNDLAGTVMILADLKSLTEGTMERVVTPQIRTILVKIAMFMRRNAPNAATPDAPPEIAMPAASTAPAPVNVSSTTVIEKLPTHVAAEIAAAAPALGPREVEQILELELVAEPPRPAATDVGTGASPATGKAAAATSSAAKKAPPTAPSKTNARGAAPAPVRGAPTLTTVQTVPARDVEVLAFEPDIQIPTAKPAAAAQVADIEVLAFEIEPPVISAAPPVPQAPRAAPAPKPAATGSTSSVRAIHVTPSASTSTASMRAINAAANAATTAATSTTAPKWVPGAMSGSAPGAATAKAAQPSSPSSPGTTTEPGAKPAPASHSTGASAPVPELAPAKVTRAAKPPVSSTQTAAVQIVSDDDEVPHLISDTGPVPVLAAPADDATSIEPAPPLPPLEPLSVEDSAADLTLFAQELIKLRSSGRTRRYEVLARSRRDAHRNEVPAAFVAESARGKDGSALDAMVVERLLTWLGKHGEAIWDSEPASFSVNLSIGAIEDEGFPQRIEQWLTQFNVPAEYIGFEITEFACVQCKPAVQRFMDAIEKIGCFLVIDNFSFDSSIFQMLGSKALRHVKLDPKVTTAAMKDKLPQALVVAILQACKVLGVHCVAKRVESQSSMQWLTAVGCDFAQSFSLHKPLPLESLASGQPIKALRE